MMGLQQAMRMPAGPGGAPQYFGAQGYPGAGAPGLSTPTD